MKFIRELISTLKRLFGYLCIIETFCGIYLAFFSKELKGYFFVMLLTTVIFAFLAFLCLKKTKGKEAVRSTLKTAEYVNNFPKQNPVPTPLEENNMSSDTYIETGNTIYRTDVQKISDKEVPYLIQAGLESAVNAKKESPNPKFHRTNREEELSFQFMMKYGGQLQVMTDAFEEPYRAAYNINDYQEKIKLYEKSLLFYQKARKFCYSKGKGGTIYFQDTWEHMHNSHNSCFSYADLIENAISEVKETYEILIPSILKIISENQGILQRDIYKYLPEFDKARIRRLIKHLDANGEIMMEKKGNSYILTLI